MDYSVVARSMMPARSGPEQWHKSTPSEARIRTCAYNAYLCEHGHGHCEQYLECVRSIYYAEQLVLFDSLAYFLPDPVDMYAADEEAVSTLRLFAANRVPLLGGGEGKVVYYRLRPNLTREDGVEEQVPLLLCDQLEERLHAWGVAPDLTARDIGCYNAVSPPVVVSSPPGEQVFEVVVGNYVLYSCIQSVKKFHPSFDSVLVGILLHDPVAKILVLDSFRPVLHRLRLLTEEVDLRSRFIFVSRLPNVEYLALISLAAVFLNPFPFGAGVTSSEALAMCVPVVTLPSKIAVLNLLSAQVEAFGDDMYSLFVVEDEQSYVERAIDIAHNRRGVVQHQLRDSLCRRKHVALFGREVLQQVSEEWATFLSRFL